MTNHKAMEFTCVTMMCINPTRHTTLSIEWLQVFFSIAFSAIGIANAQMAFPDITKASGAVKRVFSVIDRVPSILPNLSTGKVFLQQ